MWPTLNVLNAAAADTAPRFPPCGGEGCAVPTGPDCEVKLRQSMTLQRHRGWHIGIVMSVSALRVAPMLPEADLTESN